MDQKETKFFKREIFPVLLIAIAVAAGCYFYPRLPETVPSHWNYVGEVDGWSSRFTAAIGIPIMMAGMYLLFLALPLIDPKKEKYLLFGKVYRIFKNMILGFLLIIYFAVGLSGLGYSIPVGVLVPVMVGLLFIVLGNYLGKIKQNWFVGIKTPWTLSSEEVWNKTHRVGGKLFILAGVVIGATPFLPAYLRLPLFAFALAGLLGGTIGYSYLLYRKNNQ